MYVYLIIGFFIILRTLNQIIFKFLAIGPGGISYYSIFYEPLFYIAIIIFFLQFVTWIAVLKSMPLSCAYPYTSLTVITLIISGAFFFEESVTIANILGAFVIMIGIAFIAKGQKE